MTCLQHRHSESGIALAQLTQPQSLTPQALLELEPAAGRLDAAEIEYASWMPDRGAIEVASWAKHLRTCLR